MKTYNVTDFSTHLILSGTVFLLVFLPGLLAEVRQAPLKPTLAVVYLGVFPAAIAYLTWGYVLKQIPASIAASSLYTPPIFAIAIGWLVLREAPHVLSIVGGGLAFVGIMLVNTKGYARKLVEVAVYAVDRGD